jgi:hypothetical protein
VLHPHADAGRTKDPNLGGSKNSCRRRAALRREPPPIDLFWYPPDVAELEIEPKHRAHGLGLLFVDPERSTAVTAYRKRTKSAVRLYRKGMAATAMANKLESDTETVRGWLGWLGLTKKGQ